jgi:magnesium-transporting ATPase (P-type)
MITGDSKDTAVSIAKELEILDPTQDSDQYSWTGHEF